MLRPLATLLLMTFSLLASAQDGPMLPPVRPPADGQQQVPRPPARRNPQTDNTPTFSVNVKLVNVYATVADGDGAPFASLQKEDFRVFEDGVEQKLAVFDR